jgi:hypothetical protein
LRAGGLHGAQIAAVENRSHRAAEEIDTPDADLFIKQQFHMRMSVFEPRLEPLPHLETIPTQFRWAP